MVSFILRTKASSDPLTISARDTHTPQAETTSMALIRSWTVYVPPLSMGTLVRSQLLATDTAWSLMGTTVSSVNSPSSMA